MTSIASQPATVRSLARTETKPVPAVALVAIGSLLSWVLSWGHLVQVWQTGTFFDTDDAMRMVQVRSWLAGQGWFDLTVHRLDPPAGLTMHWSRIVDVPLALLMRSFALFASAETAELLTRIVFPLSLQVTLVAATIFTARVLAGPRARLPAMLLIVASCFQFGQFVAGRVDHHAPQIALLMAMTGLTADVVLRGTRRSAIVLATAVVVSMAISLENLPFIAVMVAGLASSWAAWPERLQRALQAFGTALAGLALAAFGATVPPSHYGLVVADAFGPAHALACLCGGAMLWMLARHLGPLRLPQRFGVLAASGLAVLVIVVLLCPGILVSPYAGVDPVVRTVWLSRVTEALPLGLALKLHPQAITLLLCPLLAGLLALAWAAWRETGERRAAWLIVAATTAIGLAGACWEVRVISSAAPLGVLGGVYAFAAVLRAPRTAEGRDLRPLWACLTLLPFASIAWAFVPTPEENPRLAASATAAEACRSAANVTPLAQLGSGLLFAPIDAGSHVLAHTSLSVIGAPYHRNNAGNRAVIDGFSASPLDAEAIVKATGASFVALCPGQAQAEALTSRNHDGLAAHLLADDPPRWLEPVVVPGTSYKVFAVR